MRRSIGIGVGIVMALAGCGGAIDASGEALADAAQERRVVSARPIVGTLRMRDRDVVLTTDALEARGNEDLREMTAHAATGEPVMADVDDQYHRASELTSVPPSIQAGLDL